MSAAAIDDLFGHVPQASAAQRDIEDPARPRDRLPGEEDFLVPTPIAPRDGHTPETIRTQVMKILAAVRNAGAQPFGARELHCHNVWMPYLCEWLKGG